jgi:DNA-directed RNA polymerase sigma subunit (sigma70/sigma32)
MTLQQSSSLGQPATGDDGAEDAGRTLADIIPGEDDNREGELRDLGQALEIALDHLDEASRSIVESYARELTLKEIAEARGLKWYKVAKIRDQAFEVLKQELRYGGGADCGSNSAIKVDYTELAYNHFQSIFAQKRPFLAVKFYFE